MKPYFQEDGITIYHGDCREVLPGLEPVDLVLTDPPYGIGVEYASYEDTQECLETIIRDVFPLMLAAAPVVALTPGVTNVHAWPKPRWILAWVHMNPYAARGFWGFNEWQPILAYGTDPFLKRGLGARPDVIKTIINVDGLSTWARANHPCPKPEPAWRRIMGRCAPPGTSTVVDPMMGSGTTLDSAKHLGLRAIGIEIEEKYCEIAAKRLAQKVLEFK